VPPFFPHDRGTKEIHLEYSVRAAQIAVYELLGIDRKIPPVTPHDKSLRVQIEALIKAFR